MHKFSHVVIIQKNTGSSFILATVYSCLHFCITILAIKITSPIYCSEYFWLYFFTATTLVQSM